MTTLFKRNLGPTTNMASPGPQNRISSGLALALLVATSASCMAEVVSEDELPQDDPLDIEATGQALTNIPGNTGFNFDHPVEVCFLTPGLAGDKTRIRNAVINTWGVNTALSFSRWTDCPSEVPSWYVPIRITYIPGQPNAFGGCGAPKRGSRLQIPNTDICNDPEAQIALRIGSNRWSLEWAAVHEMGHVLGFGHEHQRSDRPAWITDPANCLQNASTAPEEVVDPSLIFTTPQYDPRSVMNYCRDYNQDGVLDHFQGHVPDLSPLDIQGARSFYGG